MGSNVKPVLGDRCHGYRYDKTSMNVTGAKKILPRTPAVPSRVRHLATMSWMALALLEMGCGNASTSTSQVQRMGATQTPSLPTSTSPTSTLEAPERSNLDKETPRECPKGHHRLDRFEGCVALSLEGDYAAKSVDVGVLAPIQPAKLAALMDIEALRASIRPFASLDPSRGEALCSLFQTGEKNLRPEDVRWLKGIADRDPEIEGRYLALTLAAILTGRATSTTVNAVLHLSLIHI